MAEFIRFPAIDQVLFGFQPGLGRGPFEIFQTVAAACAVHIAGAVARMPQHGDFLENYCAPVKAR